MSAGALCVADNSTRLGGSLYRTAPRMAASGANTATGRLFTLPDGYSGTSVVAVGSGRVLLSNPTGLHVFGLDGSRSARVGAPKTRCSGSTGPVSAKVKEPSAPVLTEASTLPLGDERSVRVTVRTVPAGTAVFDVSVPLAVSFLARVAVEGADTLKAGISSSGSASVRRVSLPASFSETANSRLWSGAQASEPSTSVSAPEEEPVLGKSYSWVGDAASVAKS